MKEEGRGGPELRGTWSSVPCQAGLYTVMGKGRRWGVNGKNILWETRWKWLWVRCQQWGWQILVTMCLKKCVHVHKCAFNTMKYVFLWRCVMCHTLGSEIVISRHALWKTFLTVTPGRWRQLSWLSPYIPLQLQWELITLSFNYAKVVVLLFQKFFSWSFILSVYCLMSRLTVVSSSSSVNQFSTSSDLAIMIYHIHTWNLLWNSVV